MAAAIAGPLVLAAMGLAFSIHSSDSSSPGPGPGPGPGPAPGRSGPDPADLSLNTGPAPANLSVNTGVGPSSPSPGPVAPKKSWWGKTESQQKPSRYWFAKKTNAATEPAEPAEPEEPTEPEEPAELADPAVLSLASLVDLHDDRGSWTAPASSELRKNPNAIVLYGYMPFEIQCKVLDEQRAMMKSRMSFILRELLKGEGEFTRDEYIAWYLYARYRAVTDSKPDLEMEKLVKDALAKRGQTHFHVYDWQTPTSKDKYKYKWVILAELEIYLTRVSNGEGPDAVAAWAAYCKRYNELQPSYVPEARKGHYDMVGDQARWMTQHGLRKDDVFNALRSVEGDSVKNCGASPPPPPGGDHYDPSSGYYYDPNLGYMSRPASKAAPEGPAKDVPGVADLSRVPAPTNPLAKYVPGVSGLADLAPAVLSRVPPAPTNPLAKYVPGVSGIKDLAPTVLSRVPAPTNELVTVPASGDTDPAPEEGAAATDQDPAATGRRDVAGLFSGGGAPAERVEAALRSFRPLGQREDPKRYYAAKYRAFVDACVGDMARLFSTMSREDLADFAEYVELNGYGEGGLLTRVAEKMLPAALDRAGPTGRPDGMRRLLALGEDLSSSSSYRELLSSFGALSPAPIMTGGDSGNNATAAIALTLLGAVTFAVLQ